ncbi:MAG: MFS transporter, partial [Pseudolabrys sp.]|nr:MFS transporter [Pseudolabrys sp.]
IVAAYGLGGVGYTLVARRLVGRLGERGLANVGGVVAMIAFAALLLVPDWHVIAVACFTIGFGFYMLHNTLQTNATQMTPQARGTAIGIFSSGLYLGQMMGVALAARIFDRQGGLTVFLASAVVLLLLGFYFARRLVARQH